MHLQKIIIKGFKSFVDKIILPIDYNIVGIVGPNGCGKSNIADAIKWVLGEQSIKTLRGSEMKDVIFSGSQTRKKSNIAEVTLVFDNSKKQVGLKFNEIAITRRLYRGEGKNEYFINKQLVRLKDLQDLVFDIGLGKGTLGIISQGMISFFAESKPLERRKIFEEAAHVSKYKKRKEESLRKLEKVNQNLLRVQDIIVELKKQLKPLKTQAEKAKVYLDIKAQLEKTEIAFLVYEITQTNKDINQLEKKLKTSNNELNNLEKIINELTINISSYNKNLIETDKEINQAQSQFILFSNEIRNIEIIKNQELIEKNKQVSNPDFRANVIINEAKKLEEKIGFYNNNKNQKQKLLNLKKAEIENALKNINIFNDQIKNNNYQFQNLEVEKSILEKKVKNNSHLPYSVLAIKKNVVAFKGYKGIVKELITPFKEYEQALSPIFASFGNNIITKDKQSAKLAIDFLFKNKAGRATFIPLDNIKQHFVNEETLISASIVKGFLGVAKDFVNFNKDINPAVNFIFGSILITNNFQSALELQKLTNKKHKIITLDGTVLQSSGIISGGTFFKHETLKDLQEKLKENKQKTLSLQEDNSLLIEKKEQNNIYYQRINNEVNQCKIDVLKNEEIMAFHQENLEKLKIEYKKLTGLNLIESKKDLNNIKVNQYDALLIKRENIQSKINSLVETKKEVTLAKEKISEKTNNYQQEFKVIEKQINKDKLLISQKEFILEQMHNRLNQEYQLTFNFAKLNSINLKDIKVAKSLVNKLRSDLKAIGPINLDAISLYKDILNRYTNLNNNFDELSLAKDILLKTIKDMDEKVKSKFTKTFNNINFHFQKIFQSLFNGGFAHLEYSDLNNILESGIEVKVQPPGKKISNLNLLSGGEKSLVALSVLFAILKVNPLPICVLDEVESALDLVNLTRFANYLNTFDEQTQFLIITHRNQTMERCDVIFGVTMEEKGVSKILSVHLQQAIKISTKK